jgi:endo-1,4-beta-D-glucanase Y
MWEDFSDGAGTQTTTVEQFGTEECNQYALHTTGSGFSTYVGIGAILVGDVDNPVRYDASAYTGVRFRARLGSTATLPVRFNVSTMMTESQDSGGDCQDGGTPDTECYNHLGRFLHEDIALSTEWQEYTFCFDRDLYPLFVPSNLSNADREVTAANVLKLQFQFNNSKDLPDIPDPNQEYGKVAANTPFDFWVDDLQFITDACPETLFQSDAGTAGPFPMNQSLGSCAPAANASIFNSAITRLYEHWKARFVESSGGGYRVRSVEQNDYPSEAAGYGMMITAAMGDKEYFDGMWAYVQTQLVNGLMRWMPSGDGSASDADEDIAYGLLMADYQWGGYASAAADMINAIAAQDVVNGNIHLGSNQWGASDAFNPSYFTPSFYPPFQSATGDNIWSTVRSNGYNTVSSNQSQFNGSLVTDWCVVSGAPRVAGDFGAQVTGGFTEPVYGYDAARVPWRLGLDACANGSGDASSILGNLVGFFANEYDNGNDIDVMYAGWYASGPATGATGYIQNQVSYIGTLGVGAMAVGNTTMRDRAFRAVLDSMEPPEFNRTYYPTTLGLVSLLALSGNFPHP